MSIGHDDDCEEDLVTRAGKLLPTIRTGSWTVKNSNENLMTILYDDKAGVILSTG